MWTVSCSHGRVMLIRRLAVLGVAMFFISAAQDQATFEPDDAARGRIRSPHITEASGMAVSKRDPSKLWIINDGGSPPQLHLAGTDGADFGLVTLKGAPNTDWEDLASFTLDGKHWLLVADTGDNASRQPDRTLWLLEEPALPKGGGMLEGEVAPTRRIVFRFEGGPRDCEACAVDPVERTILLLTKRTRPPELHVLPLDPPALPAIVTTRRIASVRIPAPARSLIPFADQPTAMDIAADRSLAAVLTYYGVFIFARTPDHSWADSLGGEPVVLPPHRILQAEALAFPADARRIFVASEGRLAPIVRYQRKADP